jgi:hypothetical protein
MSWCCCYFRTNCQYKLSSYFTERTGITFGKIIYNEKAKKDAIFTKSNKPVIFKACYLSLATRQKRSL